MKDYVEIGEFITRERLKQKITQMELSNKINNALGRISIAQIEMGLQQVSISKLSLIFNVLGYDLEITATPRTEEKE